ncbi:CYFA0S22e01134g1_1 [Cyberlindnera fabianii]|uniref:CYFA0S22e01134g1_1 n=1 Tax=Cyberlindnera fabianii TaxID=36022 RepID=A0A061BE81_CYBFA|nr:CYFA0S22e01134g1_1 [Cyberlindnera fabianii]
MDYLSQLNLEQLVNPVTGSSSTSDSLQDLASFQDSTFFDFTQFQSDNPLDVDPSATVLSLPPSLDQLLPTDGKNTPVIKSETQIDNSNVLLKDTITLSKIEKSNSTTSKNPEDHKKKRNTAASARFRIKKKQKEMDMEHQVRLLGEKVNAYNDRINQLEMENACLKGLILEKNERKSSDLVSDIKARSLLG